MLIPEEPVTIVVNWPNEAPTLARYFVLQTRAAFRILINDLTLNEALLLVEIGRQAGKRMTMGLV